MPGPTSQSRLNGRAPRVWNLPPAVLAHRGDMRAPRRRALAVLGAALAVSEGVAVDWVTDRSKPFSVPFDVFAADGRLWIAPQWAWSEEEEQQIAPRSPLDIKGANWAGFQQDGCPHELYKKANSVAKYVKFLEDNGFNAVRLPLGAHWVIDNPKTGDNCGSYSEHAHARRARLAWSPRCGTRASS